MAKAAAPTNQLLTSGLAERAIPLEARGIVDFRSRAPVAATVRIGSFDRFAGTDIERFAVREGRGRELLIYLLERAARHARNWRVHGFSGSLHVPLRTEDLEDRTLATSIDIIAKSQHIDPSAFTAVVQLSDYLARVAQVENALMRIRNVGGGIALTLDCNQVVKFKPISPKLFTGLLLGGRNAWKHMRSVGPGKLGALGSWIGWAESLGLKRTACEILDPRDEEAARLYGFGLGEGPHYGEFVPARRFLAANLSQDTEETLAVADTASGLPSRPHAAFSRG